MNNEALCKENLESILEPCRQCGTCCKRYRRIPLKPEEVDRIKRLGGHVGVNMTLADFRDGNGAKIADKKKSSGQTYLIHPDSSGCVFLERRDGKHRCKIYHYRPSTCRNFKCNMSDNTAETLFLDDPIHLLGMDRWGRKL